MCRTGDLCLEIYLLEHGQVHLAGDSEDTATLEDFGIIGDPRVLLDQKEDLWQHNACAKNFCQLAALSCADVAAVARTMELPGSKRRVSEVFAYEMQGGQGETPDLSALSPRSQPPDVYTTSGLKRVAKRAMRVVQFVKSMNPAAPISKSSASDPSESLKQMRHSKAKSRQKIQKYQEKGRESKDGKEGKQSREALTFNAEQLGFS